MSFAAIVARGSLMSSPVRLVKLVIAGSRNLEPTMDEIYDAVDRLLEYGCGYGSMLPNEIVSGCARGADRAGERWADECGLKITRYPVTPAEWQRYGKKAGIFRNVKMAEYADALLAFWDGRSPGTRHMIDTMRAMGKPALVVTAKNGRCS